MPNIKIDDKEYDVDTLPDDAKKMLHNLQFVDSEIARLTSTVAVMHTSRNLYLNALKQSLNSPADLMRSDTIKLG